MKRYLSTVAHFAVTQIKRSFRDPMTLLVLFAIPILLLVIFGAFLRDTDSIRLRVAIVNESEQPFAQEFAHVLTDEIDILTVPEETFTLDEAKERMHSNELDGIILLPAAFGAPSDTGVPMGAATVFYDATDMQGGDLVTTVMRSVIEETNKNLIPDPLPISLVREPISVNQISAIDAIFSMFTGMAIMMVGVFGVASVIPYDKKAGILRRLHVTPLKSSQFMLGVMINYALIGVAAVALMTVLAITVFDLNMRGDWLHYVLFVLASLVSMLGFGLAIGGIAKNTSQADMLGQIIFLGSLAVSGVWFPRALMPELVQNITAFMPLTPIIDGIREITTESATLGTLGPELAVMGAWAVIVYVVGVRIFRWE